MGTIFVTREELAAGIKLPTSQHTRIVLVPKAICASLLGAAFDTNKTFLLPQCINDSNEGRVGQGSHDPRLDGECPSGAACPQVVLARRRGRVRSGFPR